MAGTGPPPRDKAQRRRRNAPARGEWQPTAGVGWQHGPTPPHPSGITAGTVKAWKTWFGAWYAAHWHPEDLPQLRHVARLYDAVERGDLVRATELRLAQKAWGMTPEGQASLRWAAPKADDGPAKPAPAAATGDDGAPVPIGRYAHLRAGGGAGGGG